MNKKLLNTLALGSFVAMSSAAVACDSNPFATKCMDKAYENSAECKDMEGKCGEGKCGSHDAKKMAGAMGKKAEGKCGEGKCGGHSDMPMKKSMDKKAEGKCGEGKCGGSH